jgi:HlyD family secretion protein
MKVLRGVVVLLVLCGAGVWAYEKYVNVVTPPVLYYAGASRGDVVMTVSATGTLQATRTVDVGTQVSGTVKKLYVDYNSIVKKGDLIAEIDPLLFEAALNSAQAGVDKAQIDLQGAKATLAVDIKTRDRAQAMFEHQLEIQQNLETAQLQVKSDQATIASDEAALVIAQANVEQAKVNLDFCTIRSPIDGVVVTRNADQGQTVASGFSVPSLFIIATDISTLELSGQVDESDIGKLHPGQDVGFTVDAYPGRTFHGTMTHVRLYATITSNVVTYQAIVAVNNGDLKLLPSMTATMKVEVARASNVVRVPNVALRFRPTRDMFDALDEAPLPTAVPPSTVIAGSAAEAKQAVLPVPVGFKPKPSPYGVEIDTMFGAAPAPRIANLLWVIRDGKLQSIPVVSGITDGQQSEIAEGAVQPGDQFVTSMSLPKKAASAAASPFAPNRGGGPGPGQGPGPTPARGAGS